MTHHRVSTATALFLLAVGCAQPQPQDDAAQAQAVTAAANREIAGFTSGNVDSAVAVFASDIVLLPPNEPMLRGQDSLRAWTQRFLQQASVTGRYLTSDVVVTGDWAVQRYTVAITVTPKPRGAATTEHGKGIHVFHRAANGRWLIAQDVWNLDTPAAPQ